MGQSDVNSGAINEYDVILTMMRREDRLKMRLFRAMRCGRFLPDCVSPPGRYHVESQNFFLSTRRSIVCKEAPGPPSRVIRTRINHHVCGAGKTLHAPCKRVFRHDRYRIMREKTYWPELCLVQLAVRRMWS